MILGKLISDEDSHSQKEIADSLEKLVKDKPLREQLGNAARKFTLANFSIQRLVRDHEELYKKLLTNLTKS